MKNAIEKLGFDSPSTSGQKVQLEKYNGEDKMEYRENGEKEDDSDDDDDEDVIDDDDGNDVIANDDSEENDDEQEE